MSDILQPNHFGSLRPVIANCTEMYLFKIDNKVIGPSIKNAIHTQCSLLIPLLPLYWCPPDPAETAHC